MPSVVAVAVVGCAVLQIGGSAVALNIHGKGCAVTVGVDRNGSIAVGRAGLLTPRPDTIALIDHCAL